MSTSGRRRPARQNAALKALVWLPVVLLAYHTLVRLIRRFHKFPIPAFLAEAIDNPLRRRFLTPPDRTALRHGVRQGMKVLEIGPGSGRYAVAAARRVGPTGRVTAVDIQPGMITQVRQRAEREGIANLDVYLANVYALPFGAAAFDLVYLSAVIGEIPHPENALQEFHRVLRPGGLLVFSELLADPDYPLPSTLEKLAALADFRLERRLGSAFYYTLHLRRSSEPVVPPVSRVHRAVLSASQAYDRLSPLYDQLAGSEWRLTLAGLEQLDIDSDHAVLEIGCGTGKALAWVAGRVGPNGRVIGLDLSQGMLRQAGKKLPVTTREPFMLQRADALQLPYPACSFDRIFLSFTLELFDTPEIPRVLAECRRVLRPGGRIGVVSLAQTTGFSLPVSLYEAAHLLFPVVVDCRPIFAAQMLRAAHFTVDCHTRGSAWGLPVDIVIACPDQQANPKET